ncbi:MAG: Lrp/AsnC family transcriptional regulator [Actinobacteria bacterium]|nr:Lrp/AsnC family transcriptional regulator [Actinomycetota bacterium]
MSSPRFDELDQRITAALQIDGRAAWRTIASALGEQERTVARRGAQLLESGVVRVTGLARRGDALLVRVRCARGTARMAARALAARPDTTYSYLLTGPVDCVAELVCPAATLNVLLLDELPATPGVKSCESLPILRYFRTLHEWHPAVLSEEEAAALGAVPMVTPPPSSPGDSGTPTDRAILRALREDGRVTHDELARLAGVSSSTARRRVEAMRADGTLLVRAVVNPAQLGLAVHALLWIRTPPTAVESTGAALLESPNVRYAAAISGTYQIVAEVAVPDRAALHAFITRGPWLEHVDTIESALVMQALKSSGVPMPPS